MSMCVILLLYVCPTYIDLNVYTTFHQFITPDCSYYTRYSNLTLCWTTIAGAGHIDPGYHVTECIPLMFEKYCEYIVFLNQWEIPNLWPPYEWAYCSQTEESIVCLVYSENNAIVWEQKIRSVSAPELWSYPTDRNGVQTLLNVQVQARKL